MPPKQRPGLSTVTPPWAERLVRVMDDGLRIPGTSIRFGLDGLLGLFLPELGDLIGAITSLSLVALAVRERVPGLILGRMVFNIALDALVGAIPLLGDLFDLTFKANRRNLTLLDAHRSGTPRPLPFSAYVWLALAAVLALCAVVLPIVAMVLLIDWLAANV